jgi:transglutaminase-like putative cysteine protease
MRYRVQHTTRYAYGTPVELAAHMLHLRPRPRPWQTVISERITTDPMPARRRDGLDHFGNHVTWMFMDLPHADFEVTSESVVEVDCPPPAETATPLPWETVVQAARSHDGWHAAEFQFGTPMAPVDPASKAYVEKSFTAGRPVLDALLDLNSRINTEFRFRSGVTTISTPVSQVMARKEGVCQDFSHVMISGLRGIGMPARYTSGYIRTKPPPGQVKRQGADQSHAWVGVWLGPQLGWVDVDPTNGIVVKDEHVLLGWGRDFSDVSPVRGVILGGGDHIVKVGVDLEPIEEPVREHEPGVPTA